MLERGANHYLGIDITDKLFEQLRETLPTAEFRQLDITSQRLDGLYDLITMIDVTQHIVSEKQFATPSHPAA